MCQVLALSAWPLWLTSTWTLQLKEREEGRGDPATERVTPTHSERLAFSTCPPASARPGAKGRGESSRAAAEPLPLRCTSTLLNSGFQCTDCDSANHISPLSAALWKVPSRRGSGGTHWKGGGNCFFLICWLYLSCHPKNGPSAQRHQLVPA